MNKLLVKLACLLSLIWIVTNTTILAQEQTLNKGTISVIAVIHIDVIPQYTKEAVSLLNNYHREALNDKGIKRCEVFQENGRPNHFTLVEEWVDQSAYDDYVGNINARQFRDKIQPMLGAPLDERLHTELK